MVGELWLEGWGFRVDFCGLDWGGFVGFGAVGALGLFGAADFRAWV